MPARSRTRSEAAPKAKRRNRDGEILEAAIDVFYEKGYTAASIQHVADAVGVLKGSLYYYIETKEDLLFRICEMVHKQSTEILDEVQALETDPIERIRAYIYAHIKWYLQNRKMVGVFFRDWRYLTGEQLEQVAAHRRGYDRLVRGMISDARTAGEVDDAIDEKYASFFILAAVNAVPDWYRTGGRDSAHKIAQAYADLTVGTLIGTHPRNGA
jgi:TetR/AcrR family transcriptional regulator, cholesterol catabolism regulator